MVYVLAILPLDWIRKAQRFAKLPLSRTYGFIFDYRQMIDVLPIIRPRHPQGWRGSQPVPTRANDIQAAGWTRDRRVHVIRRQLNYRGWPNFASQEKGIDVHLAVDLMRTAFTRRYDALVLFSSDTDLLPALEAVAGDRLGHVEVACWLGSKSLNFSGSSLPWCHYLDETDWLSTTDNWQGRV